jgi:hypothetical protein
MSFKYDIDNPPGQTKDELTKSINLSEQDNLLQRSELINLAEQLDFATSNEEEHLTTLCARREDVLKLWNVEKEKLSVSAALNLAIKCVHIPKLVDADYTINLFF